MSILIFDKSVCSICNLVIKNTEEHYSFPSFVINVKEPIFYFNDKSFHTSCLSKKEDSNIAINFANTFLNKIKPSNRICIIKGNLIKNYDDHIFIDLLTTNKTETLFEYNFAHIDRRNIPSWSKKELFVNEINNYIESPNKWQEISNQNNYLKKLLKNL